MRRKVRNGPRGAVTPSIIIIICARGLPNSSARRPKRMSQKYKEKETKKKKITNNNDLSYASVHLVIIIVCLATPGNIERVII